EKTLPDTYEHIGALFTDSVLQAGVNYRTTVFPRVQRVLEEFPDASTTTAFLNAIHQYGANTILDWSHPEKPARLERLTEFFFDQKQETEADLSSWLQDDHNILKMREIRGIGPKTADYMKRLLNIPAIPVDRHIFRFV